MKLLFSLWLLVTSFTVSAQVIGPNTDKQIEESIRERIEQLKSKRNVPTLPLFKTEFPKKEEAGAARPKPGVNILPQDGMPCIVPDTSGIAAIPNAAPKVYPYRKDMPTRPYRKETPDTK